MSHPFRLPRFAPRLFPALLAMGALFLLARPTRVGFAAGCALIAMGAALRLWSAGHLVKTERLTTSGPYAHVRHPLYLGTLLVVVGFGVCAGGAAIYLVPVLLIWFFLYYFPYKDRIESARLESLHGPPFEAYLAAVPALFPVRRSLAIDLPSGAGARWSARNFHANHEAATLLGIGLGLCALALRRLLLT